MEVSNGLDARQHLDTVNFSVEIAFARKREPIQSGSGHSAVKPLTYGGLFVGELSRGFGMSTRHCESVMREGDRCWRVKFPAFACGNKAWIASSPGVQQHH